MLAEAEGQVIDVVCVDRVARIEIGTCAAGAKIVEFADKAGSRCRVRYIVVGDLRNIVDRMGKRIVKRELQSMRSLLAQAEKQSIVVGGRIVADISVGAGLRRKRDVGKEKPTFAEEQDDA